MNPRNNTEESLHYFDPGGTHWQIAIPYRRNVGVQNYTDFLKSISISTSGFACTAVAGMLGGSGGDYYFEICSSSV